MKKIFAVVLAMVLVLLAVSAFAVSGPAKYELTPFKFEHHKNGIGLGNCPVYSAPYSDAYRAANGKASCATNSYVDIGGYDNGWLMVRYETNNGSWRVGYIPPQYARNVKTPMTPHFQYIRQVANEWISVSDNNLARNDRSSVIGTLEPGDVYYVLAYYDYYDYSQYYIEFEVNGQPARGFIPMC
ncbi:MAG: hypothetical protein Q4G19_04175 [Clostridia bacterium]|nr:hypothetical protein [Clostridia bacterium]